jgi:hypothetical protein
VTLKKRHAPSRKAGRKNEDAVQDPSPRLIQDVLDHRPPELRFDGKTLSCYEDGLLMWQLASPRSNAIALFEIFRANHRERAMHERLLKWAMGYAGARPRRHDYIRQVILLCAAQLLEGGTTGDRAFAGKVFQLAKREIPTRAAAAAKDGDPGFEEQLRRKKGTVDIRWVRRVLKEVRDATKDTQSDLALIASLNKFIAAAEVQVK